MSIGKDVVLLPSVSKRVWAYRFFLPILFFICPFGAVCLSFYRLAQRQNIAINLFFIILFFGLLGYTLLPYSTGDLTRHYLMFEDLKQATFFSDFLLYESLSEKPDFFLDILYWLLGKFVDTHQAVGFMGAVIFYSCMLGVILNWCSCFMVFVGDRMYKRVFIYILLAFLALTPVYEFSGMRQGNAILLFLFLVTFPFDKQSEWKRIILLLIPCLLHFSLYPIVALYLCTYLLKQKGVLVVFCCLSLGYFVFTPLMHALIELCSSLGGIGAGIAGKIDNYMFSGEVDNKLYSGSVIRFFVILFLTGISPVIIWISGRKNHQGKISVMKLRFHHFFIFFYGYVLFTSSSFIVSRNLMLIKFLSVLYLIYALFSIKLNAYVKSFFMCILLGVFLSGPLSLYLGKEYRTLSPALFYSNLLDILSIETKPEGYDVR